MSSAARNAPTVWAPQYGSTLPHGNPRRTASASVTAGLMCAPEMPPATYTPMITPMPHAQWMDCAPALNGVSTVCATTPTPKMMRVKVPSISADSSPARVLRRNEPASFLRRFLDLLTVDFKAVRSEDQWSALPAPRSLLKMPAPVRTVVLRWWLAWSTRRIEEVSGGRGKRPETVDQTRMVTCVGQVRVQVPSWRARPSTSSRRRLTAATRTDHHRSLRSMPR